MSENLIIFNAKVVTPLGFSARKGKEMAELQILEKATVEVVDGIITYVGPNRGEVRDGYYHHFWHYNARGKCLLPGFVDSHTHFVFGGERAEEFSWRLKGESYMSIMQRGGGIASTVQATRELSFIHLRSKAEGLLKKMTAMGITTVEGKSGYGLNRETELLQLKVMRSLNKDEGVRVDIVPTFLGAHALPDEYKERPDDYIDFLILERTQIDADVQQSAQYCRTGSHHGYTCVRNGILIAQTRYISYDLHQLTGIARHLHRNEGRKTSGLLDSSTTSGLFFICRFG
jgi:imidazolonepropionase